MKTKLKFLKRISALFVVLVITVLSITSTTAFAATYKWPATSNIKTYVITTKNDTKVYKTATSNDGSYGTIYASDLITINGYSGSRLKVTYPISKGTKTGYIEKSAVTSGTINSASDKWTASKKITTYRRSSGTEFGYVSKGDICYSIATSGNYTQIIYPISGGYKMGWIKTSDISSTSNSSSSSSYPDGLLFPIKGNITRSSNVKTSGFYCDYKAAAKTPIYAPEDGTVVFNQTYSTKYQKLASYGNNIVFTSSDKKYTVRCAHLTSFKDVKLKYTSSLPYPCGVSEYKCSTTKVGEKTVKKGDLIGYSGSTGNASGPHVHIEVKKSGKAVDPVKTFVSWK